MEKVSSGKVKYDSLTGKSVIDPAISRFGLYMNKILGISNGNYIDMLLSKKMFSFKAMFTLYQTVKRGATESVLDRASVHTRNAAFEAVSALEQYCSTPLLKMERSLSDRFLKWSESSVNAFIRAESATEPLFGK